MATRLYRCGGFATDTPEDIIFLKGTVQTSGRVSNLSKVGGVTGYQITAAKTFYITKMAVSWTAANPSTFAIGIGYTSDSTLDNTAFSAGVTPANAVDLLGKNQETTAANMCGWTIDLTATTNSSTYEFFDHSIIPLPIAAATKYLFFKAISSSIPDITLFVWGVER